MPEVIKYVRASLPELRGSSIMMLGRVLMNLERTNRLIYIFIERGFAPCEASLFCIST